MKFGSKSSFELSKAFDIYMSEVGGDFKFAMQTVNETDYFLALRSKLLSGEKVDLFNFSSANELSALREHVRELNNYEWIGKAFEASLEAAIIDSRVQGVPYCMEATGFLCNQDMFDYAGIPILEADSIDKLNDAFSELNEKIISGEMAEKFPELTAVTEFPALDRSFLEKTFSDIALGATFRSVLEAAMAESLVVDEESPAEDILKLMLRFSPSGNSWTKSMSVTHSMQLERFAKMGVAVILSDTGAYRQMVGVNPQIKGRASLLPIPLPNFETPVIYLGAPFYWAVNASSSDKESEIAVNFLKWLYLSETGAEYFAEEMGEASPFLDASRDTGVLLHRQMRGYISADMFLPQVHGALPPRWGKDVFAVNVQDYITKREVTWQDVVKNCQEAWNP
uniref:Putative ATPbinding transport protein n=1 Tax=termite gut metagenome TaxID=433724 RepID=S0DFC3_9ZZZZ